MSSGTATNRTNVDLPVELSREIMQKAKEEILCQLRDK